MSSHGLFKGGILSIKRLRNCSNNYQVIKNPDTITIKTSQDLIIPQEQINPELLKYYDRI